MDDYSLPPIAPGLDFTETQPDPELVSEDVKLSDSYFHPAWGKVQDLLTEKIDQTAYGTANANLTAEEYKIEDLVNKRVAKELKEILLRIQNAVESVESIKRKGK